MSQMHQPTAKHKLRAIFQTVTNRARYVLDEFANRSDLEVLNRELIHCRAFLQEHKGVKLETLVAAIMTELQSFGWNNTGALEEMPDVLEALIRRAPEPGGSVFRTSCNLNFLGDPKNTHPITGRKLEVSYATPVTFLRTHGSHFSYAASNALHKLAARANEAMIDLNAGHEGPVSAAPAHPVCDTFAPGCS